MCCESVHINFKFQISPQPNKSGSKLPEPIEMDWQVEELVGVKYWDWILESLTADWLADMKQCQVVVVVENSTECSESRMKCALYFLSVADSRQWLPIKQHCLFPSFCYDWLQPLSSKQSMSSIGVKATTLTTCLGALFVSHARLRRRGPSLVRPSFL